MNRLSMVALMMLAGPGLSLAQGVSPNGVVYGQSSNFTQDLDTSRNLTAAPAGTARDRVDRAQRQQRHNQNFGGTGRPVAAPPAPTPSAPTSATRPGVTPPTRPTVPNVPVTARAATGVGAPAAAGGAQPGSAQPGSARPGATLLAPANAVRSGQAVPNMAGQSTGVARGATSATPASR